MDRRVRETTMTTEKTLYTIAASCIDGGGQRVSSTTHETMGDHFGRIYASESDADAAAEELRQSVADVGLSPSTEYEVVAETVRVSTRLAESDDIDEGVAYWVSVTLPRVGKVELFAAPPADGRTGLEPCGSSVDDWCDGRLVRAMATEHAVALGRELIAAARAP